MCNPNIITTIQRAPTNWAIWPQTRCHSTNISEYTMAIGYSSVLERATYQNHYHQSIRSEKPSNLSPNTTHNLLVFAKWCHRRLYIDDWYPTRKPSLVPGCANPISIISNLRAPKNWPIWPQTRSCPSTNISGYTMAIGYSSVRGCATQFNLIFTTIDLQQKNE